MLYMAFKIILKCSLRCETRRERLLVWGFFVTLMGHCVGFLGVSYFGQIMMLLYMNFGIVRFLSEYETHPQSEYEGVLEERYEMRPELTGRF